MIFEIQPWRMKHNPIVVYCNLNLILNTSRDQTLMSEEDFEPDYEEEESEDPYEGCNIVGDNDEIIGIADDEFLHSPPAGISEPAVSSGELSKGASDVAKPAYQRSSTVLTTALKFENALNDVPLFAEKVMFYSRCELLRKMPALAFNGTVVQREEGTAFKTGQEVFLCPKARKGAIGKTFYLMGTLFSNAKHPVMSYAVLLDHAVCSSLENESPSVDAAETSLDAAMPIRLCPLKFVAKVPGGKCFGGTVLADNSIEPGSRTEPCLQRNERFLASFFVRETTVKQLANYDFTNLKAVDQPKRPARSSGKPRLEPLAPKHVLSAPPTNLSASNTPLYIKRMESGMKRIESAVKVLSQQIEQLIKQQPSKTAAKSDTRVLNLTAELKRVKAGVARQEGEIARLTAENERLSSDRETARQKLPTPPDSKHSRKRRGSSRKKHRHHSSRDRSWSYSESSASLVESDIAKSACSSTYSFSRKRRHSSSRKSEYGHHSRDHRTKHDRRKSSSRY